MSWLKKPASDTQITHRDRLWLYIVATIIMLLLVIPTFIVMPMSFSDSQYLEFPPDHWSTRWYAVYFESSKWMRATVTSVQVGILTMLVATPMGVLAAYALFVSGHRAAKTMFAFLITPMIVPVILIAIGTFYAFGRVGLNNTITGLVLAHAVLASPLVMIIITSALRPESGTCRQKPGCDAIKSLLRHYITANKIFDCDFGASGISHLF